ncbi:MAG TPA: bifunctional diaminohydroxyphosphoribosylaminopyrimidine deaminase/5-amino-6-(5-phosphoribosylamino)uracil reductase RibD, partial [Reyranella sp.]|nr:bifunctional diaminohydroxyphosphoribosylaminopyrimidine deaminase/5-amino-6-(5-phosphoribosylamino)uracil reductase RibD [Reyranella sp.]
QALAMAGEAARGATLYVTLEPCNHWGQTPPCSDAVVAAGIARVVIGLVDPDPRTAGESIKRFNAEGIETAVVGHVPSLRLHEGFVSRVGLGRPFVTVKLAVSADGMIGRRDRAQVPITGDTAQRWTHMQRALSDAVMVGGATANLDNPQLTVRLPGLGLRTPRRLVLAGHEPLGQDLTLFLNAPGHPVAVIGPADSKVPAGIAVWTPADPSLPAVMKLLATHGISRLLVEGGAKLVEALLSSGLVDRFHLLQSQATIGEGGVEATAEGSMTARLHSAALREVDQRPLGDDMLTSFERQA